jgi:hypothetical protein
MKDFGMDALITYHKYIFEFFKKLLKITQN